MEVVNLSFWLNGSPLELPSHGTAINSKQPIAYANNMGSESEST